MTDPIQDPKPEAAPRDDAGDPDAPAPPPDRRAFLHHLSRDAVWSAGRVAGFSSMIRRSVFAAGEAASLGLDPPPDPDGPASSVEASEPPPATTPPPAAETTPRPVAPDPVQALTTEQQAFLSGMSQVVLAANDPAGAPHVTTSIYHWDGATFRLPGQQFTLRASNVERDPRVSLLIEDPASGASVAVSGLATVVYGDRVEDEMLLILAKYGPHDAALRKWEEMRTSGDRIAIDVRPTRFIWRSG